MKKLVLVLLFASIDDPRLFAQDDPSGSAPDDATTAMISEQGDPIGTETPDNEEVPADPNFSPPEGPFVPDFPESSNYEGPVGVTGIFNGNVATGCSYDPLSHSAHRAIDDIVVPGSIGKYPLKMTRYYNSRQQYYALNAIGLSPGWAHEYSWLMWGAGTKVISPHGSVQDFYCGAPVGVSEGWEGAHTSSSGRWRLADGGTVVFENSRVLYIDDPYGQRTTVEYDGNGYRSKVTEPGGRYLKFIYGPATDNDGTVLLTRVEAHALGNATVTDWVNYSYSSVSPGVPGRNKKMLTGVSYSDGTSASYQYCNDNVHEGGTTHKMYPLLQRCDDIRYNGPMRTIWYEYESAGPHGAIMREKSPGIGITSAISPGAAGDTFTETRGDGPTRSFTYTHMFTCHGEECGPCSVFEFNPPQQMLTNYTDFQGHATTLGYNANWYINSVRDANNHTTTYERGPAPPAGIGQILTITHPGGVNHINYTYYDHGHYVQQITNERGAITYHFRDANHRITRTDYKDATGNLIANETFSYNSFGQVLTHRLKNGAYQHFQYDNRGLLLAKTNPTTTADWQTALNSPAKTTYSYWTNWVWADRVFRVTLPRNGSSQTAWERYEYDRNAAGNAVPGRGLVTKITHADSTWQSFGYSQFGNKMWEENELRQRTSYTYDNYNRVLSVTKPLVGAETFGYLKPNTGSPYLHTTNSIYTHTSRAGIVTTNVYDPDWRKTSTTTAGARTQFAYDYVGNLTDITDPRSKVTHNGYDNRNRKTSTTEAYGITGLATTTVWHYDAANNINRIDRPDSVTETKGYDALNRVIWHTVPKQVPGQNPINLTTHIDYNPSGTINWIRDANNHTTTFAYNASDERIAMTYPGGGGTQSWVYDDAHNLTSRTTVRGAPETQRFTYDLRNRKVGMTWDNGADSASFSYDDASRLLTANNPNSNVTRAYDAAGRLTRDQQAVTGLGPKNLTYPLYDDDGRLKRVSLAGVYDYSFGYDSMGRFETITPTGGSVSFKYYYDNASNETMRHNYLNNVDQIYTPDSLNRMAERYVKKGAATYSHEVYKYDRMSRLTEVSRSEDSKRDVFGYYWTGELHTARYGLDLDAPIQEGGDPDMDSTDNVDPWAGYQPPETPEAEPTPPPDDNLPPDSTANTAPSAVFTPSDTPPAEDPGKGQKTAEDYVADGNLGPAGAGQPDTPTSRSVTYNLDKAGNRTSVTDDVNGNATYAPNVLNQYTSVGGSSVGNGGEHEIQTYNNVGYTYLNDERLTTVKTPPTNPTYTYNLYYDALGRCVKRSLNGVTTYYIYDGEKPILEYRSTAPSNPAKNVYGKGIDEILMRDDPSFNPARTFYYQQDHQGSVSHLTNTSGNVVESYRYDAFGAPAIYDGANPPNQLSSSAYSNRFLFTGREYANLFGFYEYRARAYHPTLGRFMSEDPKGFVRRAGLGSAPADWAFAAHPDEGEFNLFRYCGNDPIDFTDPMGLWVDTILDIGFIAYDVYKLATDSSNRSENWKALGLDVAGAAIPAATGLGAAYRAGKALEHSAEAVRATHQGTEVVQRAMSKAELVETKKTHLLRGGREGTHHVSDAVNSDGKRARQRLSLPQKPEVRATLEVPAGRLSEPSRVLPNNNMLGGGTERTATGSVPVQIKRVDEYSK